MQKQIIICWRSSSLFCALLSTVQFGIIRCMADPRNRLYDKRKTYRSVNDVWLGYEAVILAGVTIGDGAVIGARAVVTKNIPPYTIAAGVPARPIRRRFSDETIDSLLKLRWWEWPAERISRNLKAIQDGRMDCLL